mmetsp:Transcript_2519/g.7215  ORF Transcript_2519/g.7215 Transcript_2519/m.7215 type:complete len:220 (-) Transcript_2519:17-676(-)
MDFLSVGSSTSNWSGGRMAWQRSVSVSGVIDTAFGLPVRRRPVACPPCRRFSSPGLKVFVGEYFLSVLRNRGVVRTGCAAGKGATSSSDSLSSLSLSITSRSNFVSRYSAISRLTAASIVSFARFQACSLMPLMVMLTLPEGVRRTSPVVTPPKAPLNTPVRVPWRDLLFADDITLGELGGRVVHAAGQPCCAARESQWCWQLSKHAPAAAVRLLGLFK